MKVLWPPVLLGTLMSAFAIAGVLLFAGNGTARAQSYAPETFFHDPVQRVFPVELARVLAWRENVASNAGITEVQYRVNCAGDGAAEWSFRWLDASGAARREARIHYGAGLLREGARFYREVARQFLQGREEREGRWAAFAAAQPAQIEGAFWEGHGGLGMSRLATVRAARAGEAALRDTGDAAAAARHGGLLLACALPGMNRMLTLDSTLAARGAAWLALAESAGGGGALAGAVSTGTKRERPWAVALWIARRQNQAGDVWRSVVNKGMGANDDTTAAGSAGIPPGGQRAALPKKTPSGNSALPGDTPAVAASAAGDNPPADAAPAKIALDWWDFIFSPHTPREARLQAARVDSPAWGVVMLHSSVLTTLDTPSFARGLKLVADIEYEAAHDYAGEIMETGVWTYNWDTWGWFKTARAEWLAALRACEAAELGAIPGAVAALEKAAAADTGDLTREKVDGSLVGFREAAELLRAGYNQGAGALAPVAAVTARDLLNHGWEFFGVTFARRHHFLQVIMQSASVAGPVAQSSPVPANFAREVLSHVPEFGVFFNMDKWDPLLPRISNIDRLQRVELAGCQLLMATDTAFGVFPVFGGQVNAQRAVIMAQRSWLMGEHFTWGFWAVAMSAVAPEQMADFLRKLAAEGGPTMDFAALVVTTNPVNNTTMARIPGIDDLRQRFARNVQPNHMPWVAHLLEKQTGGMTHLERARYVERLYWQGVRMPGVIGAAFPEYQRAGAIDAIKLLHKRLDGETFTQADIVNNLTFIPYAIAIYENDSAALREISGRMGASPASSGGSPVLNALMFGNPDALEAVSKAMQVRALWNDASQNSLQNLVELWRGLSGNTRVEGRRALLENFTKNDTLANVTQDAALLWLFARRLKLTDDEATLLFTGRNPIMHLENSAYTAWYRKDREAFRTVLEQMLAQRSFSSPYSFILLLNLRRDLLDMPQPEIPDDPRPSDWRRLEDELLDIILARNKAKTKTTTAATP